MKHVDVLVRGAGIVGQSLALSLAVDRDRLTRSITGLGETPAYGIVPPGIPGYTPAALPWAAQTQAWREARAKALYRAAGYSETRPLTLELRYNTSTPHRRLALAVERRLGACG